MTGKRRLPDDAVPTTNSPTDHQTDLSDEDTPIEHLNAFNSKAALDKANKVIRKQKLLIKRLREQIRRDNKKITLQNKVLNDLMEIYGLKNEDIAVLRTEILKTEVPGTP